MVRVAQKDISQPVKTRFRYSGDFFHSVMSKLWVSLLPQSVRLPKICRIRSSTWRNDISLNRFISYSHETELLWKQMPCCEDFVCFFLTLKMKMFKNNDAKRNNSNLETWRKLRMAIHLPNMLTSTTNMIVRFLYFFFYSAFMFRVPSRLERSCPSTTSHPL